MATQNDARKIASDFPEVIESADRFALSVRDAKGKEKGFAWVWMERKEPKGARVPNAGVLAVRVNGNDEKTMLLEADGEKFFTEPHYNGFPAILVRLAKVSVPELRALLLAAYRIQAPRALRETLDGARVAPSARRAKPKKSPTR